MAASIPELKFVDLADMLKRPEMSPEAREQRERGRRRGYRDGWIDCLLTFERVLDAHAYTAGFDFWQVQLLEWLHEPNDTKVFPPELPYKAPSKKGPTGVTPSQRFQVLKRDGYRCKLCGIQAADGPYVRLEVDHRIPRVKGGTHTLDNLWTLCNACNRGKGRNDL